MDRLPKPNTQALSWFYGELKKKTLNLEPLDEWFLELVEEQTALHAGEFGAVATSSGLV